MYERDISRIKVALDKFEHEIYLASCRIGPWKEGEQNALDFIKMIDKVIRPRLDNYFSSIGVSPGTSSIPTELTHRGKYTRDVQPPGCRKGTPYMTDKELEILRMAISPEGYDFAYQNMLANKYYGAGMFSADMPHQELSDIMKRFAVPYPPTITDVKKIRNMVARWMAGKDINLSQFKRLDSIKVEAEEPTDMVSVFDQMFRK